MLQFQFDPFPELFTERLHLRRVLESDVAEIYRLRSDPRVLQYLDRDPCPDLETARKWIAMVSGLVDNNEAIQWAVSEKDGEKLMGYIGLWRMTPEHHRGEIGYALLPEYFRKGVMKEALRETIRYAFSGMKLHSIEAKISPGNEASIRLVEGCGFVREGYFREDYYWNGRYFDTLVYGLLEADFRP